MKVYQCWSADHHRDKEGMHEWCTKTFGRGNVEKNGWSLTSHYNERWIGNDSTRSPYLFKTTDPKKLTMFALKWS